jgi:ParB family transcriptional regulator, chromosome partitioning protein
MSEETAKQQKRGLGRGLAALLGDDAAEDNAALDRLRQPKEIPTEQIQPNRFQPRVRFDDEAMEELVQSVREKGILQPILVRRTAAENTYEIIAGERRWRAAQKAQLHQVPVIIRDFNDAETLEVALVENLQRQDLNAVEEANGYVRLIEEFHHTQDRLAEIVGKSRSHIANTLRLLSLPDDIKNMVVDGRLTAGHARTLLSAKDPHALARQIVDSKLTVRQAEELGSAARGKSRKSAPASRSADTVALETSLSNAIGMKVSLVHHGNKGGTLKVAYRSLEQLDDLCRRLLRHPDSAKAAPARSTRPAGDDGAAMADIGAEPADEEPAEAAAEEAVEAEVEEVVAEATEEAAETTAEEAVEDAPVEAAEEIAVEPASEPAEAAEEPVEAVAEAETAVAEEAPAPPPAAKSAPKPAA